jgi:peroxiredoxin
MTLSGPACVSRLAKLMIGISLPTFDLGFKTWVCAHLVGREPVMRIVVLVLSRGGFCPKERRQHEGLIQLHRELEVAYCKLVTISTDGIIETNEFRSGVGAHWPFLSDRRRVVQKDLDIDRIHGSFAQSDDSPHDCA